MSRSLPPVHVLGQGEIAPHKNAAQSQAQTGSPLNPKGCQIRILGPLANLSSSLHSKKIIWKEIVIDLVSCSYSRKLWGIKIYCNLAFWVLNSSHLFLLHHSKDNQVVKYFGFECIRHLGLGFVIVIYFFKGFELSDTFSPVLKLSDKLFKLKRSIRFKFYGFEFLIFFQLW